ncbi:hypothetical protein BKA82DRAFT_25205 [Pisolithus tinctorius]|nr:hypothetical protein BKA82DRAFT_25205 [Pisolithus tinctorius]
MTPQRVVHTVQLKGSAGPTAVRVETARKRQKIDDNNNLFDYNNVRNAMQVHLLTVDKLIPPPSYSSTMLGKPKLYPESARVELNKSLHCTPTPIYATTEYHHMPHSSTQLLSPYVTPPPNVKSILSMFNTPFNPHELKCTIIHS